MNEVPEQADAIRGDEREWLRSRSTRRRRRPRPRLFSSAASILLGVLILPSAPTATPTPTAPATCVPTLGITSYCATHCEPCPTIRAGCNAQACRDCIENPVCSPEEICVPWNIANPGCCSCATATASVQISSPTPTPTLGACVGDCDGNGSVTISELITMINVALGNVPVGTCPAAACENVLSSLPVNCAIVAVNNALTGCPARTPVATPTPDPDACTLEVVPRSFAFGDVPIGEDQHTRGFLLLALAQDSRATSPITVNLTFDPSPPYFDGFTLRGSSMFPLEPGSIDDHLIRCVPTEPRRIDGTLTVTATNCPAVVIPLTCNGTVSGTPTRRESIRTLSVMFAWVAVAAAGGRAIAASDPCESAMTEVQTAGDRLTTYTSRADATTSNALRLTGQVMRALKAARDACAGTDKEAGLKFSTASMERIEAALVDAKTERLHDLGIFVRPDEP